MTTPTALSLKRLHTEGYPAVQVVEHWNAFAHIRQDLYGIIDILAVSPSRGTLGVQTTAGSSVASRVRKVLNSDHLNDLLAAGWRIEVHGWAKRSVKRGAKLKVWQVRVVEINRDNVMALREAHGIVPPTGPDALDLNLMAG